MVLSKSVELALARWLAHGCTSRTHPVLASALATCFHPLGIEADWLEYEPFGADDLRLAPCWLRAARWNPRRLDPAHPAAADFSPWSPQPSLFHVDAAGVLRPGEGSEAAFALDPERSWRAVRHSVRAGHRAATFLQLAAGLLLADDPMAAVYAAGDDSAFASELWRRHAKAMPIPTEDSADPAAPDPRPKQDPPRSPGALRADPLG